MWYVNLHLWRPTSSIKLSDPFPMASAQVRSNVFSWGNRKPNVFFWIWKVKCKRLGQGYMIYMQYIRTKVSWKVSNLCGYPLRGEFKTVGRMGCDKYHRVRMDAKEWRWMAERIKVFDAASWPNWQWKTHTLPNHTTIPTFVRKMGSTLMK